MYIAFIYYFFRPRFWVSLLKVNEYFGLGGVQRPDQNPNNPYLFGGGQRPDQNPNDPFSFGGEPNFGRGPNIRFDPFGPGGINGSFGSYDSNGFM